MENTEFIPCMEKMKSNTPLDYAVFQLSPTRSRCELFVSSDGSKEKLASGLLTPFVAHLKVAEEQVASAARYVKLEVGQHKNAAAWFTKGTIERFVRFVSTPEVLELVSAFDVEMSQLEAARRIYSQGTGDQLSGGCVSSVTPADDATKKELLRAIDTRLVALQQDLCNAAARAAAAGFNIHTIPLLQTFADAFGAHHLNEACGRFISVSERRADLINSWKSSYASDMSIDDGPPSPPPHQEPAIPASVTYVERDDLNNKPNVKDRKNESSTPESTVRPGRRLSVQDRINMFESKQKENSLGKPVVPKPVELRRLSSDVSSSAAAVEKAVLRRWSGASDGSIHLSAEKKETESTLSAPSSEAVFQNIQVMNPTYDTANSSTVVKPEIKMIPSLSRVSDGEWLKEGSSSKSDQSSSENDVLKDQLRGKSQPRSFISRNDSHDCIGEKFKIVRGGNDGVIGSEDQGKLKVFHNNEELSGPQTRISGVFEDGAGSRVREAFAAHCKGIERESSPAPPEVSSAEETEVVVKRESHTPEKVSIGSLTTVEDSIPQIMKFRRGSAAELSKKAFSGKVAMNVEEGNDSFSASSFDQFQRVRQSKGNQELNDELKMKANELEKLFAEHKLRVPGDQSNFALNGKMNSLQPTKPAEDVSLQLSGSYHITEAASSPKNKVKLNAASLAKTTDIQKSDDTLTKNIFELSVSEGSRGKFYDKYMQRRDAKLREEWSSNRMEKETRLKSLQDSIERSGSEMKAKLSRSADKRDLVSSAHRRAERIRSYNSRSIMKKEQLYVNFGDDEDDEALEDNAFGNDKYGVSQEKKLLRNNRSLSSSNARTSAALVSRSASKTSSINSGKRRSQPDNPLAQSVLNFSDLRKENANPSSGGSKVTRAQMRNFGRSKSNSENMALVKDDKYHKSQSLRKSCTNPSEFKDMSDGVVLTTVKFDEEVLRGVGTKPFLKKGSRTGSAIRASIAKQKGYMGSDPINNKSENDDLATGADNFTSKPEDVGKEEFETKSHKISDNGEPRIFLESNKFVNSESENGDSNLAFSLVDQVLGSQLLTGISSSFLPVESAQDWPGESPVSWDSRAQHPFSYPNEMSDVDASVDSPIGSPASWNSHPLNQMESDTARMRKKWGTAQKSMLAANSSNVSRKDMTRGFKRLLKFGRKNRGSESLVDWISATTSDGDDDSVDGRDLGNRASEDLRKSRMGFPQTQPSADGEFFNESVQSFQSCIPGPPSNFKLMEDHISGSSIKAPRSFFSLSSFRSKGSDSKPR